MLVHSNRRSIVLILSFSGILTFCRVMSAKNTNNNADHSADCTTVPDGVEGIFKSANVNQSPVLWAGRPYFGEAVCTYFVCLVIIPAAVVPIALTLKEFWAFGPLIGPVVFGLVFVPITNCRTVPMMRDVSLGCDAASLIH